MTALQTRPLLSTAHVFAADVICRADASGDGSEEYIRSPRIILPRRGVFLFRLFRREWVADVNTVLLMDPRDVYRVSHPVSGGDACTVIVPSAPTLEEAFDSSRLLERLPGRSGFRLKRVVATPRIQYLSQLLPLLDESRADLLQQEETAMAVVEAVAHHAAESSAAPAALRSPAQRRYVERARAFIACRPTDHLSLEMIGKVAFCSPYHLARHFRIHTGATLHQYQIQLRLALALERMAAGEENLAWLAVNLGFASHSHFSAHFKRIFGVAPREARAALTRQRVAQMRRILTAVPQ